MKKDQDYPTLIDRIYAGTFEKETGEGPSRVSTRQMLYQARRFSLDDGMSSFLTDLSTTAFMGRLWEHRLAAVEAMRVGARAPFPLTWVEYNLKATIARMRDVYPFTSFTGKVAFNPAEVPEREGWLIQQHPKIETAFQAFIYTYDREAGIKGFDCWRFPWSYCWTTVDSPLPYAQALTSWHDDCYVSPVITGVAGYNTNHAGVILDPHVHGQKGIEHSLALMREWAGALRRMWAFLSTLADLPVRETVVTQSRGFFRRGNYRKFLDHKTITLTVPATEHRKVARRVVLMARRRAHHVRGHWRLDWRFPGAPGCAHLFRIDGTCACGAKRMWITSHERGDASLGYVTHDYKITHPEKAPAD
jgi:hypothetical protein